MARRLFFTLLLLGVAACGPRGSGGGPPPAPDVLDELRAVPGITAASESPSLIPGTRFFALSFDQPVDHDAPAGARFSQRLTMLYRAKGAPVVLASTGYGISGPPPARESELVGLLRASQLLVEHRYFTPSIPQVADWARLDIRQAAGDHHRVVEALRPLLGGKWVSAGGSKGGMTSVFHRRFFPADVDGTVAYVAPISYGVADPRYLPFVDSRGTAGCRAALEAWQQATLGPARAEARALLEADAAAVGSTVAILGSDRTLEYAVLEAPFTLWQYSNATLCAVAPPAGAAASQLYAFLDACYAAFGGVVPSWDDAFLSFFAPYYYQAATQLGAPELKESHLASQLAYPGTDRPGLYPPDGVTKTYDGSAAMIDVQQWVTTSAERILFVYGENDPWTAGAFEVPAAGARDIFRYTVPAGNHGASISQLAPADRDAACAALARWTGAPVPPPGAAAALRAPAAFDFDSTYLPRPFR